MRPWFKDNKQVHIHEYNRLDGHYRVQIPELKLELTNFTLAGVGRRATVYKASGNDGVDYALKIINGITDKNLYDVQIEAQRQALLFDRDIACTPVVALGFDFVVKKWVSGVEGSDWLEQRNFDDRHVSSLMWFFSSCINCGILIRDLKPRNLVLEPNNQWVCIDPGQIDYGKSRYDLYQYYKKYVLKHWCGVRTLSLKYIVALSADKLVAKGSHKVNQL